MKVSTRISRRRNGTDCRVIYPGHNIGVAKVSIVQGVFFSYEKLQRMRSTVRNRNQNGNIDFESVEKKTYIEFLGKIQRAKE